jgi:hypothetical protein
MDGAGRERITRSGKGSDVAFREASIQAFVIPQYGGGTTPGMEMVTLVWGESDMAVFFADFMPQFIK